MRAVPTIAADVTITPVETPHGLRYRLRPARRGGGTVVPPRTLVTLMLMDGERDLAQIHDTIAGLGIKITDPAKLLAMIRLFESAGVVELAHHYVTPGPLRHVCEGCGQSCEGHLVGPIESDEATHLETRLIELRMRFPEMPDGPATVEVEYDGETHRVLNFPGGSCIFLDEARRCRLHAQFGPHSKPLPCRMFPVRMVRTETGTRVSISPRCFRAHRSYQTAEASSVEELMADWRVWRPPALVQGLDPDNGESLATSEVGEVNRAMEELVWGQLDRPDRDLAGWLTAVATGHPEAPAPSPAQRERFGGGVLVAMQQALRGRFAPPVDDRERPSRFAGNVGTFVRELLAQRAQDLPDWNDLPPRTLDYVRHALRHLVFAREVMTFGGVGASGCDVSAVSAGVLAFAMGVMAARWLTASEELAAGELDDFVTRMTVWVRLSGSREFQEVLFPSRPGAAHRASRVAALYDTLASEGGDG